MWQGVRILGTYGSNAYSQNGYLYIGDYNTNPSIIQHAVKGIANWDDKALDSPGGKVLAVRAVFADNKTAAEFVDDGNTAAFDPQCPAGCRNQFLDCEFKMTAAKLLAPYQNIGAQVGISMNGVNNVDFKRNYTGNKFIGYNSGTARLIKAIDAYDSEFSVIQTTFTNCSYGLKCETSSGSTYIHHSFSQNTFNNCYYAIHMRNGINDFITNNKFNPNADAYSHSAGSTLANKYGIYLDASSGFTISGNEFKNLEYAITVINSGASGGLINLNKKIGTVGGFTNCWRAIYTLGDNPKLGLKCNSFESNTATPGFHAHWFVSGKLKDQGIAGNGQPNSGSPAGNSFQHTVGTDIIAIKNTTSFKYYYISANNGTPTLLGLVTALPVTGGVQCSQPEVMVLANNIPEDAEIIINNEEDDELRQLYVSQLSAWFDDNEREQERINLLIAQNEEYANQELIPIYIAEGDYAEAMDLLQEYYQTNDPENDDYYDVMSMQLSWSLNSHTAFDMDNDQQSLLREIAEHETRSAATARVILNQVFSDAYEAPYYNDTTELRKSHIEIETKNKTIYSLILSPNPVDKELILSFSSSDKATEVSLLVYDLFGQIINKLQLGVESQQIAISTEYLPAGIYYCKLEKDNSFSNMVKLVVQH